MSKRRDMRSRHWITVVALLCIPSGCGIFNPNVPVGLTCSSDGECPPDQVCSAIDNRCYRTDNAQDASVADGGVDGATDAPPGCVNEMRDDEETDIDCGGPSCSGCANGLMCQTNSDCQSDACGEDLRCTSCPNGATDGLETDIDCGGSECPACQNGQACQMNSDCASDMCGADQVCASCPNGTNDGFETDTDCGGMDCPACEVGLSCLVNSDCQSGVCAPDMRCAQPRCGDGVVNQPEEECDDGDGNNSDTEPDACRQNCTLPYCGDGVRDTGEEADPPMSPSPSVSVDPTTCRYDFSGIRQLYCVGSCGSWDGMDDCGQGDADDLCRLMTGNPNSTATNWGTELTPLLGPGICCPPPTVVTPPPGCDEIPGLEGRGLGVDADEYPEVSVHPDLSNSSQTGTVVTVGDISDCTDP